MARTLEEMQALNRAVGQYTGKQVDVNAVDPAFMNSGVSLADRIREVINSPEAQSYARSQADAQYGSQINSLDRQSAQTKSDMDTLIAELQKQQQDAPEQIFSDFNRRGLFRSSAAEKSVAATTGKLASQLGNAQIQRSTRLADLATQRASLLNAQTQFGNNIINKNLDQFNQAQEAELQRQHELQIEQMKLQAALARAGGGSGSGLDSILATALAGGMNQGQAPQQPQYDPNEDLSTLIGGQPAQEVVQSQNTGLSAPNWGWAQGGNSFGTFNNNPVKNYISSVQTPSFLQGILGKNLFAKG